MFDSITKVIGIPLGWIMYFVYSFIPNYGIALLFFTFITRLALFPIAIKQHKTSLKSMVLSPELNAIKEKYAGDNNKILEEQQKVMQREGHSQTAGCLPMVLQMLLLFGVIDVIYRPMKHILRLSDSLIATATTLFGFLGLSITNPSMIQMDIIRQVQTKPNFFSVLGHETVMSIQNLSYRFLGMDLMLRPTWSMINIFDQNSFNPIILIPIVSGLTSLAMSIVSTKYTAVAADPATSGTTKSMMMMMPVFSLFMTFSVPAGVGLYWIYSNIFAMLQTIILHKIYNPDEMKKQLEEKKIEIEEQTKLERAEAKKKVKSGQFSIEDAEKALSLKEADRMRLAEARKRDAEKYGEIYVDDESDNAND